MFYSATTGGFYLTEIHGINIPEDVIEISDILHHELLMGQSEGKVISTDASGNPVLITPVFVSTVPKAIEMRQARLALLKAGHLAAVKTAIESLEGDAGEAARIEWEYAQTVVRSSQLVVAMSHALSLTETEVDDLFILGTTL